MKKNVIVTGHRGSWYQIDTQKILDKNYYLMEHEQQGDEVPCIIVDEYNHLVCSDCHNGFNDLYLELEESEEGQKIVCSYLQSCLGEGWNITPNTGNKSIRQNFIATWQRVGLSTKHTHIYFELVFFTDKSKWNVFDVEAQEIAYGDWYDLEPEEIETYKKRFETLLDMGAE